MIKASAQYGGEYDGHKKKHDDFLAALGALTAPVPADKIDFAKEWSVLLNFYYKIMVLVVD